MKTPKQKDSGLKIVKALVKSGEGVDPDRVWTVLKVSLLNRARKFVEDSKNEK